MRLPAGVGQPRRAYGVQLCTHKQRSLAATTGWSGSPTSKRTEGARAAGAALGRPPRRSSPPGSEAAARSRASPSPSTSPSRSGTPSWRPSCRRRTRTRRRTRPSCRRRTRPSCRTRTRTRPSRRTRPRTRTLLCGCSRLLRELINSLYLLRDSRACLELDQAILQSVSQCDGVVAADEAVSEVRGNGLGSRNAR